MEKILKKWKAVAKYAPTVVWLFIVFYVFFILLGICKVASSSMEPTLSAGDVFVINRLAYKKCVPQRGDVISFDRYDEETGEKTDMAKRVIGLPGEEISFADGYVYVNGELLDESDYLGEDVETNCAKTFNVPDGCVFVMGDNRENSLDARYWENPYTAYGDIDGSMDVSMEGTVMRKQREINYVKPNMGALRGRIGRSIIETIMNTPKPDRSNVERESREFGQRVLAVRQNVG